MQVTTEQIANAINVWVENELLTKGTLTQQGLVTFLYLQSKPRIKQMLDNLNFLSDNGKFESEELRKNLHKTIDKMGGFYVIPLINYKLDVNDIDYIFSHM